MRIDDDAVNSLAFPRPREDWQMAHNAAIALNPMFPSYPFILLASTIAVYLEVADPYVDEHILTPLLAAGHEALNLERGALDGGRCSEWLASVAELRGIQS